MPIKSKAAVSFAPGHPLEVVMVDVADPGPGEVLIKLEASGLCHSDLNFIDGTFPHHFPVIFGHEGIGRVVACGAGVTVVALGDRVIPYLVPDCGECVYCRSGRTNNCLQWGRSFNPGYRTSFSYRGDPVASFNGLATFSEYGVVSTDQIVKVREEARAAEACCIGCGVTTGLGAVLNTAKVDAGSSVVVVGLGGVGLSAVQGARIAGATRIFAVDVNDAKEALARNLGATNFLNPRRTDVIAAVMEATGIGADFSFECVGRADCFEIALGSVNKGWGTVVSIGVIPDSIPVPVKWTQITGRTWRRSFMGGAKRSHVAQYVEWLVEGKLHMDGIVSHTIPLEDINHGFEMMQSQQAARTVILY